MGPRRQSRRARPDRLGTPRSGILAEHRAGKVGVCIKARDLLAPAETPHGPRSGLRGGGRALAAPTHPTVRPADRPTDAAKARQHLWLQTAEAKGAKERLYDVISDPQRAPQAQAQALDRLRSDVRDLSGRLADAKAQELGLPGGRVGGSIGRSLGSGSWARVARKSAPISALSLQDVDSGHRPLVDFDRNWANSTLRISGPISTDSGPTSANL